jgi:hypothetical protein
MAPVPDPASRGLLGGTPARVPAVTEEPAPPLPEPAGISAAPGETVVHYHFPVEIEVRGAPEAPDPEAAARLALRWLTEGLHSL